MAMIIENPKDSTAIRWEAKDLIRRLDRNLGQLPEIEEANRQGKPGVVVIPGGRGTFVAVRSEAVVKNDEIARSLRRVGQPIPNWVQWKLSWYGVNMVPLSTAEITFERNLDPRVRKDNKIQFSNGHLLPPNTPSSIQAARNLVDSVYPIIPLRPKQHGVE